MANFFLIVATVICMVVPLSRAICHLKVYEYGVSPTQASEIVKKHNYLRTLIAKGEVAGQPKGVNLKRMKWDANLAQAAQNIANTCVFAHVAVADDRWRFVGQNLYTSYSTVYRPGANWTEAIQSLFDEYKVYTYPQDSSHETGHYTQIVWADTSRVGCGYTYYLTNTKWRYKKLYVCNYGPGGNINGLAPYKSASD